MDEELDNLIKRIALGRTIERDPKTYHRFIVFFRSEYFRQYYILEKEGV